MLIHCILLWWLSFPNETGYNLFGLSHNLRRDKNDACQVDKRRNCQWSDNNYIALDWNMSTFSKGIFHIFKVFLNQEYDGHLHISIRLFLECVRTHESILSYISSSLAGVLALNFDDCYLNVNSQSRAASIFLIAAELQTSPFGLWWSM